MARRKKAQPQEPRPNDHWTVTTELQINGRNVIPGTELKIYGERGRFVFMKHVDTGSSSWIDVWGGPYKSEKLRSFAIEQVQTVHYKKRTVKALAQEYKDKKQAVKEVEEQG